MLALAKKKKKSPAKLTTPDQNKYFLFNKSQAYLMKTIFSSHIYWLNYHRYKYNNTLFTGQNRGEQTCFSSASKTQSCDKMSTQYIVQRVPVAWEDKANMTLRYLDKEKVGWPPGIGGLNSRILFLKEQRTQTQQGTYRNAQLTALEQQLWKTGTSCTEIRTSMLGDKVQERLTMNQCNISEHIQRFKE